MRSLWVRVTAAVLLSAGTAAWADSLRFFVLGDIPYSEAEIRPMELLMGEAVAAGTPFIVHVGDIKGGGAPCTDEQLAGIARVFSSQPVPVVYAVGDNEWTDCHRWSAGQRDPLERLAAVRRLFFAQPEVLRLGELPDLRRVGGPLGEGFPEIYSFTWGDVLLVVLHVVGSENNEGDGRGDARSERQARDRVNLAMLERAARSARDRKARAIVIFFQADPAFERSRPPRGYVDIHGALLGLMSSFPGPVLLVHGDTHQIRDDRPLLDPSSGAPIQRFHRAEVPGSPVVGGLWISVTDDARQPFRIEPAYPSAVDVFRGH